MSNSEKSKHQYHHANLRSRLITIGLEVLEKSSIEALSLREIAKLAGVSKSAPYRHFSNKEMFLASLADEGFRLLYGDLLNVWENSSGALNRMGQAYMAFAIRHPALYRLMSTSLLNRMPDSFKVWARKTLTLLSHTLAGSDKDIDISLNIYDSTALWAYIHGLVLIRIDDLFPKDLPEPDWETLAGAAFLLSAKARDYNRQAEN